MGQKASRRFDNPRRAKPRRGNRDRPRGKYALPCGAFGSASDPHDSSDTTSSLPCLGRLLRCDRFVGPRESIFAVDLLAKAQGRRWPLQFFAMAETDTQPRRAQKVNARLVTLKGVVPPVDPIRRTSALPSRGYFLDAGTSCTWVTRDRTGRSHRRPHSSWQARRDARSKHWPADRRR